MTVDAAILAVVVAFLLPLRLLSLALRFATSGTGSSAGGLRRSCAALALTAALLAAIFALPRDHARECAAPTGVADGGREEGAFHEELRAEVEQLNLQLARFESLWYNNSKVLDDEGGALEEKDGRVIRALGFDVQSLIDTQEDIKNCAAPGGDVDVGRDEVAVHEELRTEVEQLKLQLARLGDALEEKDAHVMRALGLDVQFLIDAQENIKESLYNSYDDSIKAMENEVQIIKDELRKMYSDIYNVQSLTKDTTERVEALHSDIKKIQVITDEWGKINSNINRAWSFAKDTEKKVEDLYSDIKKGFKRTKRKMP
jgi:DNA repair exonuclease SbcCD ATPase subunit